MVSCLDGSLEREVTRGGRLPTYLTKVKHKTEVTATGPAYIDASMVR